MPEPRPDLAAIRERLIPIGTWRRVGEPPCLLEIKNAGGGRVATVRSSSEAEFIAHAPADLRALVARVTELEAALREIADDKPQFSEGYSAASYRMTAQQVLAAAQEEPR